MTLLGTDAPTPAGPVDEVTVTGELREVGGPAPGVVIRARGDVVFEATDGERTSVPTDEQGRFSTTLESGEYTVTGSSPQWNQGRATCRAYGPAVVTAAGLNHLMVDCHIR